MSPKKAIETATDALQRGNLPQVHSLCKPLLDNAHHGATARALMAQANFLAASHWLQQNNLRMADLHCRLALALNPQLAEAHHLLGVIARKANLPRYSLDHFQTALTCQPEWPKAQTAIREVTQTLQELPDALRLAPQPAPDSPPRYLLIKAWGTGFFSEAHHVTSHCLLAELSGRIPVVQWDSNCLFTEGDGDGFSRFFAPLSEPSLADLPTGKGEIFPPKWSADTLNTTENQWLGPHSRLGPIDLLSRSEPLVVSDFYCWLSELRPWIPKNHWLYGKSIYDIDCALTRKYLAFAPSQLARAEAFKTEQLKEPYLAVHIRGSDKTLEQSDLKATNRKYKALLAKAMKRFPKHKLLVLTDSQTNLEQLERQYGDRVVSTCCKRTRGQVGVHHMESLSRTDLGDEVLLDVMLALDADYFIGNAQSNISRFIREFKDWRSNLTLIGSYDYENLERPLLCLIMQH